MGGKEVTVSGRLGKKKKEDLGRWGVVGIQRELGRPATGDSVRQKAELQPPAAARQRQSGDRRRRTSWKRWEREAGHETNRRKCSKYYSGDCPNEITYVGFALPSDSSGGTDGRPACTTSFFWPKREPATGRVEVRATRMCRPTFPSQANWAGDPCGLSWRRNGRFCCSADSSSRLIAHLWGAQLFEGSSG